MMPHPARPGFTPARKGPLLASDVVWPAHEPRTLGLHELVSRPRQAIALWRVIKHISTVLYPHLCEEAGAPLPADWKAPGLFSPAGDAQELIEAVFGYAPLAPLAPLAPSSKPAASDSARACSRPPPPPAAEQYQRRRPAAAAAQRAARRAQRRAQ
jgi:hypothetical protein